MRSPRILVQATSLIMGFLWASPGVSVVCQVPTGPYPTVQSAVDNPVCTEIELAAQTFQESVLIARDLEMRGVSTTTTVIEGQLTVLGGSTQVVLEDLTMDGSALGVAGTLNEALLAEGGAEVIGLRIVVLNATEDLPAIFSDGFESGDTSAWSAAAP